MYDRYVWKSGGIFPCWLLGELSGVEGTSVGMREASTEEQAKGFGNVWFLRQRRQKGRP